LAEVTPLAPVAPPGAQPLRKDPFSLLFRAPADCGLPQQIYRLEHHAFDGLELFLVPLGPDSGGMLYEAVVN
jgi:hypothetical protein